MMGEGENIKGNQKKQNKVVGKKNNNDGILLAKGNSTMLAQVVGIIIGSPEFQRK